MSIQIGLTGEMEINVQNEDSARASGDTTLPAVLSTPRLIGYLEITAHRTILPFLDAGQTTVGSIVNLTHLAATPIGMHVRLKTELLEMTRRRLRFRLEAWDEVEKIAEGEHVRFIIDRARFDTRLAEKSG